MSTRERFEADWLTHADGIPPTFAEPVKEICWALYQAAEKATALRCVELCTDGDDALSCWLRIKAEFLKEGT